MKKLISCIQFCLFYGLVFSQTTATYDLVFTSNWDAHGALPNNAHYTELVGATHNANITFLELGGFATLGIEQVAELGVSSTFRSEVEDAITANNADQFIQGPNLYPTSSDKTITINDLTVSSDYPLVSLASMIAPSPDWMIAVNSVSLVDNGGQWISEITLDLFAYDAGTEEGTMYQLSNPDTNPQEPISMLTSANSPFTSIKIGTIVFTQKSLSIDSFDRKRNIFTISPNPSDGKIILKTLTSSSITQVEVFSILGKKIKKYTFDTTREQYDLDLTNLGTGIYLLKAYNSQGKISTQKLILK